jgi:hypothetical protein
VAQTKPTLHSRCHGCRPGLCAALPVYDWFCQSSGNTANPLPMISLVLKAPSGAKAKTQPNTSKPVLDDAKKRQTEPTEPLSQTLAPNPQPEAVTGTNADSDSQTSEAGILEPIHAIADYLHNPKPHYPGFASNHGWEGLDNCAST